MFDFYPSALKSIKQQICALLGRPLGILTTAFTAKNQRHDANGSRVAAAMSLQLMANDMEAIQPSLAAELRCLASRS